MKKEYINPATGVIEIETAKMLAASQVTSVENSDWEDGFSFDEDGIIDTEEDL